MYLTCPSGIDGLKIIRRNPKKIFMLRYKCDQHKGKLASTWKIQSEIWSVRKIIESALVE